jgi:hypothetical protein
MQREINGSAPGGVSVSKPTFASVTEEPCICGYLDRAADDPASPVVFDAAMNEYHLEFPDPCAGGDCEAAKAFLIIYHCPFCGGAAPESKRAGLFTTFTPNEHRRLNRLFDGMRTLQDVIATLGPPDEDKERGLTVQQPEKDEQAPTLRTFRALRYTRLSDTANVEVYADAVEGKVHVMLMGKYIGSPTE